MRRFSYHAAMDSDAAHPMPGGSAGRRVAVVGAGLAGAACARALADAGFEVQVFDKSRGAGGRMATRRAEWAGADGTAHPARFDHGAPGFSARVPAFARFVAQAEHDGLVARWSPRLAPGSYAPLDEAALWVATPDMPALARALLAGVPLHTGITVDALLRAPAGPGGPARWRLGSGGAAVGEGFDAVVVAIPPPQAAPLVQPHHADWAARAQALSMLPGWALMAVTDEPDHATAWDLAWPATGPLGWVVRNDAKPGRTGVPGVAQWVAHATAAWSRTHLEAPAAEVQSMLQAALAEAIGRQPVWHHGAVHRWRYASVPRTHASDVARCAWDADAGLGLCGDAWGGPGVEGAWLSGQALAQALIGEPAAAGSTRP